MEKFLSVSGDVYSVHFQAAKVLAEEYFDRNILGFLECYEAFEKNESSDLGQHWVSAQKRTNLVCMVLFFKKVRCWNWKFQKKLIFRNV